MAAAELAVRMVVTQLCNKVPGGTARYAEELLGALAASRVAGTALDAVAGRRCPRLHAIPVPVRTLGIADPLLARLWEHGLPPRPARRGIVHAPTLMLPPRSRRYSLIVTIHDLVPWTHSDTLTRRGVAFHRRMGARAAQEAALVITPTQAVARQVHSTLSPQAPVVAVSPGVTVQAAPPDGPQLRRRLAVPDQYILFVGTAEPRKGLDVLVEALARPELAGWHLVVVGPVGWGDVRVTGLAQRAGVAHRVHLTGRVPEPTLAALYGSARALAMPSRAEGFGFPVVEAMAHGVPVVTSDDPALVEVAGDAAVVTPRGDAAVLARALAEVLADGRARTLLTDAGPARAQAYTWAATARRMWSLYREVAAAAT